MSRRRTVAAKRCPEARGFGEAYPRVLDDADSQLNRRIEVNLVWAS